MSSKTNIYYVCNKISIYKDYVFRIIDYFIVFNVHFAKRISKNSVREFELFTQMLF